ncbi:probable JmjC domain-containing histone demethylation protein 2C [Chiloscyllium plagiosum]|uniref:probable JmjC domain-containing histone demethylation protein 2C n=1 Tax=Chiloscyllium plagiosum TaxID=36176 RepID=UPI001CB7D41B|nr:probable JmjC domain-containing histone demethylation protein 2C [Chiloscyllium plagiosum]
MQGPYSLNGYRVRVYRQDSATQWFTGIITYHDLLSRTMIVMNDQVLEPQNVDPSMVQMTFLDDVVHSLLKGENIGITSRRRSRSSQNNPAIHVSIKIIRIAKGSYVSNLQSIFVRCLSISASLYLYLNKE